jgi:hypothetical protein
MPENKDERRFSEAEFALILRRAVELDAEPVKTHPATSPPRLPPEGLTLSEIQEIAAEVGITPARIAEALESIEGSEWSPLARLFGGPPTLKAERRLEGPSGQKELASYLDIVRDVMKTQGESHEVLGGVEWKWDDKLVQVTVRIAPDVDASKVVVSVERGPAGFLSHYVPIMSGLGAAGLTIGILEPSSAGVMAALVAGGAAAGYSVARAIWVGATRRWQKRIRSLTSRIAGRSARGHEEPRLTPGDEPFED